MAPKSDEPMSYSRFACIGAGISGIGLGATLKRWYGIEDVAFFERHQELGGTWFTNQYPGCACDVPSPLYSYSFEPNPEWSRVLPSNNELWSYLDGVATKYDLKKKMKFGVSVERCEWVEESARWRLTFRHIESDATRTHECQFLFHATGQLVQPRELDVPGAESFRGPMFHTARWRSDVDLRDKKVVVFGNGCTGAQLVPAIVGETASLTHFVRAKHWILPAIGADVPPLMHVLLRWLPGLMGLQRLLVFLGAEESLRGFPLNEAGRRFRAERRAKAEAYMRSAAPAKYHDLLIPDFEIGCKRRIFDSGYLESLHRDNVTLTDERPLEVVPEGVRTADGVVEADVIILANGFVTGEFFKDVDVRGRGGETPKEHWSSFGGPEAYNCTALSGFPNMFMLLGPNTATGHTSTIMASENSINYALRVIRPLLEGRASVANVKWEAEKEHGDRMQDALRNTVWNSGCQSWYITKKNDGSQETWNPTTYPWSQGYFWYHCLFPVWSHWEYSGRAERTKRKPTFKTVLLVTAVAVPLIAWYWNLNIYHSIPRQLQPTVAALVARALTVLRGWKALVTDSLTSSAPFSTLPSG